MYSPSDKTVYDSRLVKLPWPIMLITAGFNWKQIFQFRRIPELATVQRALHDFENRVRWRYVLRDQPHNRDAEVPKSSK